MCYQLLGYARTQICHDHFVLRRIGLENDRVDFNVQAAAFVFHRLDGVADQIDKNLLNCAGICQHHGVCRLLLKIVTAIFRRTILGAQRSRMELIRLARSSGAKLYSTGLEKVRVESIKWVSRRQSFWRRETRSK